MPKPTTIESLTVLAPDSAAPANSADLVAIINRNCVLAKEQADQAAALGRSAAAYATVAGLQLIQLKKNTPHGQWEAMFTSGQKRVGKSNGEHVRHLEFGRDTARNYIALATKLTSKKFQPEELQVLMALSNGAPVDEAAAKLLDEIIPAKTLRQIYLELGIVKPTPKEAFALAAQEDATTHAPPPPKKKGPMSLAEQRKAKRDEARLYWFGSTSPGMVGKNSLMLSLIEEAKNPAECQLHLLSAEDLAEVETTLKDVLKVIKTIKA